MRRFTVTCAPTCAAMLDELGTVHPDARLTEVIVESGRAVLFFEREDV